MKKAEVFELFLDDHIEVKGTATYSPENGVHFRELRTWVLIQGVWVEVTNSLSPSLSNGIQCSTRLKIADDVDLMNKLIYGEADYPQDEIA